MDYSIQDFLLSMGYQKDISHNMLFVKEEVDVIYLIQITGASYNQYVKKEAYLRNNQRLIFYWNGRTGKPVEILNLIIVPSIKIPGIMEVAKEIQGVWLLDEEKHRIVLFEEQDKQFDSLYQPLEDWFQGLQEQEETSISIWEYKGTIGLIVINLLVFLWVSQKGDVYSSSFMFKMGAQSWYAVFYEHEYYRMITSMFLHFGWEHLFNNMLVLGLAGNQLEKKIGTIKFLILYFLSGIMGNLISNFGYAWQGIQAVCAGASGAIYGVLGAILIQLCFQKHGRRQLSPIRIIFLLLMSFYLSVTEGTVDYYAHTGGFLMGILLGALFAFLEKRNNRRAS